MNFILHYIIPFALALGVLILVHELGHYLVARRCGVMVLRFSIGFGRPLLKVKWGETEWALAVFPLGGYVKMLGEGSDDEVGEHESHRAFNRQSVGRRFAIVAAGPLANLLLAVALYWGLYVGSNDELRPLITPIVEMKTSLAHDAGVREGDLVLSVNGNEVKSWRDLRRVLLHRAIFQDEARLQVRTREGGDALRVIDLRNFSLANMGKEDPIEHMGLQLVLGPLLISQLEKDGAAANGGMLMGDEIVAIDGKAKNSIQEIIETIRTMPGQERAFTVRRGGEERTLLVTIGEKQTKDGKRAGYIGVAFGFDTSALKIKVNHGPFGALAYAVRLTWENCALTLKAIGQMIRGNIPRTEISGPITIADYAGKSAQHGAASFIQFLAFISISLGVLNLLPIPVLDGGHLLYYAAEFIKGSALSDGVVAVGQKIGLAILFMLMAFALYNDINRLIS